MFKYKMNDLKFEFKNQNIHCNLSEIHKCYEQTFEIKNNFSYTIQDLDDLNVGRKDEE